MRSATGPLGPLLRTLPMIAALAAGSGFAAVPGAATDGPVADGRDVDSGLTACLQRYLRARERADVGDLKGSVYPGAMLFWTDENGRVRHLKYRAWKKALAETRPDGSHTRSEIEFMDRTRDVAVVKIVSRSAQRTELEYVSLVRSGAGWRIVARIALPNGSPPSTTGDQPDRQEIEALLQAKFQAMDGNDAELLTRVYYPRAMSYYVDEDDLVGVSIGEWVARFDLDRADRTPIPPATRSIQRIDTAGSVGFARFTHRFAGMLVTDYALLLKSSDGWRIINLLIAVE